MFNKNFLGQLTVLYVEDEENIRHSMLIIFDKLFKKVIIGTNGLDGYDKFRISKEKNIEIDLIISDINMPELNGLEMIKKIRSLNGEIPIILTTAFSDSNYFLDAISLGVYHYAIKPVKMKELMVAVQDAALKHYQKKVITSIQNENSRYLDIINQVAIVSKTDLSGNIIFANDMFCEVSGYTREELIGSNQRIIRHQDMPTVLFDSLWNTLRAKKVWKGKIKNKTKFNDFYFVNAHIFPVFDQTGENVIEYMAVRFLITEDELEKRDFKQKVIKNIKDSKISQQELKEKIKDLEFKLSIGNNINIVYEALESEKRRSNKFLSQIKHYEKELEEIDLKTNKLREDDWNKINSLTQENKELKNKSDDYFEQLKDCKDEIKEQSNIINKINQAVKLQKQRILELEDVIKYREMELEVLKGN